MSTVASLRLFNVLGFGWWAGDENPRLVFARVLSARDEQEVRAIGSFEIKSAIVAVHLATRGEPPSDELRFFEQIIVTDLGAFPFVRGDLACASASAVSARDQGPTDDELSEHFRLAGKGGLS